MKTISAIDTAKLILARIKKIEKENAETVSRLKLLKLLYYIQGYHLAMFNKPLFNAEVEAWDHGPVVRSVYNWIRKQKDDETVNKMAFSDEEVKNLNLHDTQIELIDDVLKIYNKYSAYGLRDKTHKETPWLENYEKGENNEISKDCLKRFFTPLVERWE